MPPSKQTSVQCPDHLIHSTAPTERPLLIYDGDCYFCLRWIRRWQQTMPGQVDVASFQSEGARFVRDIPIECFQSAVRLIETDGNIYGGAEAVCRMLSYRSGAGSGLALWCYRHLPGYAAVARFGYGVVARHRKLASIVTTALWGKGEEALFRPAYYHARRWFLRLLGAIYLIAFASLWIQIDGLIGHNGILPVALWLEELRERFGPEAYRLFPTLCWFNPGDWFLHFLCAGGVVLSLLLILGITPILCLLLLWAFYLSLCVAGQVFKFSVGLSAFGGRLSQCLSGAAPPPPVARP
jgi:lipase maturation factor 1